MNKYSVHVWITPLRAVRFPDIEASSLEEAWKNFTIPRYRVIEQAGPNFGWAQYAGNNGRVYRRKVKVSRL